MGERRCGFGKFCRHKPRCEQTRLCCCRGIGAAAPTHPQSGAGWPLVTHGAAVPGRCSVGWRLLGCGLGEEAGAEGSGPAVGNETPNTSLWRGLSSHLGTRETG